MVGARRHPAACVVPRALCSMADHTLRGRDTFRDVLQQTHIQTTSVKSPPFQGSLSLHFSKAFTVDYSTFT